MMHTTAGHLAKHIRDVYFGGNWTSVNLQEQLALISWEQAVQKVPDCNTILALVYHINYYAMAINRVLIHQPINAHDKYSYDHPPVSGKAEWEAFVQQVFAEARLLADRVESLPDSTLFETFVQENYGTYLRNLMGFLEHTHYHLGQIVILRKRVTNPGL